MRKLLSSDGGRRSEVGAGAGGAIGAASSSDGCWDEAETPWSFPTEAADIRTGPKDPGNRSCSRPWTLVDLLAPVSHGRLNVPPRSSETRRQFYVSRRTNPQQKPAAPPKEHAKAAGREKMGQETRWVTRAGSRSRSCCLVWTEDAVRHGLENPVKAPEGSGLQRRGCPLFRERGPRAPDTSLSPPRGRPRRGRPRPGRRPRCRLQLWLWTPPLSLANGREI